MPADAWAVSIAIGERAHSRTKSERVPKTDGGGDNGFREKLDPTRGRMAGLDRQTQDRRIDDTMLIREAQQGNAGAFEELVRHYDQAVLRLALHLTGTEHDAQDVYQDAFLKA